MLKILFICTHNRCRSIMSEAITNHYSKGKFLARSAGSQPTGEVHPLSLHYLSEANIPTESLISQSWEDFEAFKADFVITVCDSAAKESCPIWFGNSRQLHWGLTDPSKLEGSEEEIARGFRDTIAEIHQRVQSMLQVNLDNMSSEERVQALITLGAEYRG